MIPGKAYTPEAVARIAWRRRWLIVVPFLVVAPSVATFVHFIPNRYRSETTIMVVPQRVPESYVRSTVTARIEDRLQSISPQILSRPRLERIIADFDLHPRLRRTATLEEVVERVRGQIAVQVVKGDVFRVSYVAEDPGTAMRVTERLAALFIEENLHDREVLAEGTNQFIETQLDEARRSLKAQEAKLEEYRQRHPRDMPGQLNANLQAQHNVEGQAQALADALRVDRDRRLSIQRQLADMSALDSDDAVGGSGAAALPQPKADEPSPIDRQLESARDALQALETRLRPEHPDVIRARRLVADLERKARAQPDDGPAPTPSRAPASAFSALRANRLLELQLELAQIDSQLAVKEDQERRLRATIADYQARVQAVPARESELSELTRDYETIQQLYRNLLGKREESKIAANLERQQVGEQFKILDPAQTPEKPFSPDRLRLSLLGAAAGLIVGLALAGVLEFFDTSMRSEADVLAALQLPVLASIPLVAAKRRTLATRSRSWSGA